MTDFHRLIKFKFCYEGYYHWASKVQDLSRGITEILWRLAVEWGHQHSGSPHCQGTRGNAGFYSQRAGQNAGEGWRSWGGTVREPAGIPTPVTVL